MLEGVPDRLGPYSLAERLGEGAQAAVFLAQDPEGRAVAVKVRRAGDPEEDRRFLREFESMRLLRVPGVVAVHSAGVDGDLLWFSMDRVHGRPFSEAVLEEPYIPERVDRTIDLATSLLDTLAGLHAAGFAHRDIKPSNVLVDPGGGVHVLDFGIGQDFRSSERLGAADFVLGTVAYMAPEQLANLPTDERADLFAVGLMLHEAIAGPREVPRHVLGWIPRTCVEQLTPLATRFRQVPLAFSHLVERLLSVDPRDRPSARRAAAELRRLRASEDSLEAPEPPFVDPGHWWTTLEGCLGQGDKPIQVLEGPAGSGRRRIAEQLHRLGLLDQIWTLHLHCRVDQVGGPLLELMEVLIASFDAHGIRELVGDRAAAVRAAWPHLAVAATHPDRDDAPLRATDVVDAVVHTIAKLAATRNLLLVIHDTEQVDPLTARVLAALAEHAGPALGLLLIVDPRWHRRLSRNLVKRLDRMECVSRVQAQPPTAEAVQAIARSLSPESEAPFDVEAGVSPQLAVEAGLSALAQWRGFRWPEPNAAVWPLAVHDAPLPVTVYRALVGRRGESTPLVEVRARGVCLTSAGARRMARVRLASLAHSATLIATAWEETLPEGTFPGDLAALWLLADNPSKARPAAALAAIAADRLGRFLEARAWLTVIDAYPANHSDTDAFELARVRSRVALRTETDPPPLALLDEVAARARSPRDEQRVALLRAEFAIRRGELRGALVHSLSVASHNATTLPWEAARARLVAVRCRLALGQDAEALAELERTQPLIESLGDPVLTVQHINWQAELARRSGELIWSQALCQQAIKQATDAGYSRGAGHAALRLAQVQRLLGRRRRSEQTVRAAQDAFTSTGGIDLATEADLTLATLLVERGGVVHVRRLLDQCIRRIRSLHLDHLLPAAMRCALQLATLRLDHAAADFAIDALAGLGGDEEVQAALVRWWRVRGEPARALDVPGPPSEGYGLISWRIEKARAALAADRTDTAIEEAAAARGAAEAAGYGELTTAAALVLGAAGALPELEWRDTVTRAESSTSVELALGALELSAWRMEAMGDPAARDQWRTLRARAAEIGHRPAVQEAAAWLSRPSAASVVIRGT